MRVKNSILAAYVAPCLPICALGLPVIVYLPPYYAGTLGLPLATVGLVFLLVRLIDVPFDPIIGHLVDRTNGRFGRFRPWVAGGAALMVIGLYLVFMATPGISAGRALFGLVVMYIGLSAAYVAHTAWGAVLSEDYHERSRVFGWWQMVNVAGLFLILAVPPVAQMFAGAKDAAIGIQAMGWVIIACLPVAVGLAVAFVPDTIRPTQAAHHLSDIAAILRLPVLRRLLLAELLACLAPGLSGALLLFFFEAARGYSPALSSTLLLFYFAAGLVAGPGWVWLSRRISKHRALFWSLVIYAVLQTATMLIPRDHFALAAMGMAIAGLPAVAPAFLLRAMLADVSEAETLDSGLDRTGLFFASLTVVQKLGYAIPVGLSYPILGLIGFVPALGENNSAAAIAGLEALFVLPPAILALLAAAVVWAWPIDAAAQARNAEALKARMLKVGAVKA